MRKAENMVGKKYGKLTVGEIVRVDPDGKTLFRCRCDCGREVVYSQEGIYNSGRKNVGCGCGSIPVRHKKPGDRFEPAYDCLAYEREKNNCVALSDMLCTKNGKCVFYTAGRGGNG